MNELTEFDFSKEIDQKAFLGIKEEFPVKAGDMVKSAEAQAWKEHLLKYALENYQEYLYPDPKISPKTQESRDNFVFAMKNFTEKQNQLISDHYEHGVSSEMIDEIMEKLNVRDDQVPTDEEELNKFITRIVLKDLSYQVAFNEREHKKTAFEGFEDDKDFRDVEGIIKKAFSGKLLSRCLTSRVSYNPNEVNVEISGNDFYLPLEKYKDWKAKMPSVADYKYRGESFSSWNADLDHRVSDIYASYPIYIYSFEGEDLAHYEYLKGLPGKEKMRIYKIGTVCHELGHSIYDYLMGREKRSKWEELINMVGYLTHYSKNYASGVCSEKLNYKEEFAEAVRLKTTRPDYLKKSFPDIFEYLDSEFPELKAI